MLQNIAVSAVYRHRTIFGLKLLSLDPFKLYTQGIRAQGCQAICDCIVQVLACEMMYFVITE